MHNLYWTDYAQFVLDRLCTICIGQIMHKINYLYWTDYAQFVLDRLCTNYLYWTDNAQFVLDRLRTICSGPSDVTKHIWSLT